MKVSGLRGRSSVMNNATPQQEATVARMRTEAAARGVRVFETRHSTWIGPGCAAEHGAVCVITDGRIDGLVWKDGGIS